MSKELDMISGSEMAFHIENLDTLTYDNENSQIILKCEIGQCNYQIQCQGPFESTPSLDIYKGMFQIYFQILK